MRWPLRAAGESPPGIKTMAALAQVAPTLFSLGSLTYSGMPSDDSCTDSRPGLI
jgi:hypothetical protein